MSKWQQKAKFVMFKELVQYTQMCSERIIVFLTLRLLMSYIYIYIYIYGAPSIARNANVVYIWTYVWQR